MRRIPPALLIVAVVIAIWELVTVVGALPPSIMPGPRSVAAALAGELMSGRLFDDMVASLFRVAVGFSLSLALAVPLGLWLGQRPRIQEAVLPGVNFFRSLSPLAWMPFAILWFGIGDMPSIFLIVMATFFPLLVSTLAAVASVPKVYLRVAKDYGIQGWDLLTQVTLPAIMPELITAVRLSVGVAWVVVVAAEMIAGPNGLGFAIWDARNGLRTDLLVAGMVIIGAIGVILDRLLCRLMTIPSVRWGYER